MSDNILNHIIYNSPKVKTTQIPIIRVLGRINCGLFINGMLYSS